MHFSAFVFCRVGSSSPLFRLFCFEPVTSETICPLNIEELIVIYIYRQSLPTQQFMELLLFSVFALKCPCWRFKFDIYTKLLRDFTMIILFVHIIICVILFKVWKKHLMYCLYYMSWFICFMNLTCCLC